MCRVLQRVHKGAWHTNSSMHRPGYVALKLAVVTCRCNCFCCCTGQHVIVSRASMLASHRYSTLLGDSSCLLLGDLEPGSPAADMASGQYLIDELAQVLQVGTLAYNANTIYVRCPSAVNACT